MSKLFKIKSFGGGTVNENWELNKIAPDECWKVGVVFQTTQKTPQPYIPLSDGIESSNEKGICSWSVCTSMGRKLLRLGGTSRTEGHKAHSNFSFHSERLMIRKSSSKNAMHGCQLLSQLSASLRGGVAQNGALDPGAIWPELSSQAVCS